MRSGQVQLIAGPLYHNGPFLFSHLGLFEDQTIVLLERFDAGCVVDLIERHRVNFALLVPTMMGRIIRLPDVHERDFSSLDGILHTAAPCPSWLKRAWIDLIGAVKVFEGYGSSEGTGNTVIRGDEWLDHPHSVGRPTPDTEILILDPEDVPVNPGEAGEIYMRQKDVDGATYQYIGSPPARTTADGFVSVGDIGWVDAEGYLFLADRRVDLIITGGANVYPAEVEAAISEHSLIFDVAVIGPKDDEWGRRVHAIVQLVDTSDPPTIPELDTHCRERLAAYKVPKSYEFVDQLPRNAAGKIRRSALLAEREDDAGRG
jgi:bile acid-coenzyme A ligase